jgi:acyl-CoA reductase-like NAD-dependent aldehyde dehydrogenase
MIGRPVNSTPREIQGYISRCEYFVKIAEKALAPVEFSEQAEASDHSISINTVSSPYSIDRPTICNARVSKKVVHEPLGTVFVLSAWNYPYLIACKAVIPALLAGNVVIIKPSSQAPAIAERMVQSMVTAGMPKNVFQYIHTNHIGTENILRHRSIRYVHYTGSIDGGQVISETISSRFVDSTLELGGCDAAYVRPDADLKLSAIELVDGCFFNSGQCCCGVQRIYVHEKVYDEFIELFRQCTVAQYGNIGDPMMQTTTLGPCIKASAADALRDMIEEDIKRGAVLLLSNSDIPDYTSMLYRRNSPYLPPVVLTDTNPDMHIQREELFGPVASITKVSSDSEAVALINDNPFGLTASIWTRDKNIVSNVIGPELQVGTVYQNKCDILDPSLPWASTKHSGKGVSMSFSGFMAVTRPKSFYLREVL